MGGGRARGGRRGWEARRCKCKKAKVGHTVVTAGGPDGLKHRTWGRLLGEMVSLRRSQQDSAVTLNPSPTPSWTISVAVNDTRDWIVWLGFLPSAVPFSFSLSLSLDDHKQPLSLQNHGNNWVLMLRPVRGRQGALQQ